MNSLSWLLYFGDLVENIKSLLLVLTVLCGVVFLVTSFLFAIENVNTYAEQERESFATYKKYVLKGFLPAIIVSTLLLSVTPSKQTIYMIAASETGETVLNSPTGQKAVDAVNRYLDSVAKPDKENT